MGLFATYWQVLSGFRWAALRCIALTAISGLLEGVALLSLAPVLNHLMYPDSAQGGRFFALVSSYVPYFKEYPILVAISLFVLLGLASSLIKLCADTSLLSLRSRIEEGARVKMSRALLGMSWPGFSKLRLGDLSKSILTEGHHINFGAYGFLEGLSSFLVALVFLVLSFFVSFELSLFALGFGALGAVFYFVVGRKAKRFSAKLSHIQSGIADRVGEVFANLKFHLGTGNARRAEKKLLQTYSSYTHSYFWAFEFGLIFRFIFESGAVIFVAGFLLASQYLFNNPLSSTIVFMSLFYRMVPRFLKTQEGFFQARNYCSWVHTWRQRLELAQLERDCHVGQESARFTKDILIDTLTYTYPSSATPAVSNLTLHIPQGHCIAVVGPSGSGKSTFLDLVLGLLPPSSGRILVDGVDLAKLDLHSWRSKIGLVTQESPVFFGTVLENIAWADDQPNYELAEKAARLAHAWEFIERLPQGLDTVVGEKGGTLSGGQRQRIAIARALYKEPWLLILDEATSALDSESEAYVQTALRELKGKFAILIVAHRLSTVSIADTIVVLNQGTLIEKGSWGELTQSNAGVFQRMVQIQKLGMELKAA
jgi:ATP-binding cassette subfamily C protein